MTALKSIYSPNVKLVEVEAKLKHYWPNENDEFFILLSGTRFQGIIKITPEILSFPDRIFQDLQPQTEVPLVLDSVPFLDINKMLANGEEFVIIVNAADEFQGIVSHKAVARNSLTDNTEFRHFIHDLKNPVANIYSYCDLLLSSEMKISNYDIELIQKSSKYLLDTLENSNFISSISTSGSVATVELTILLRSCIDLLQFQARQTGHRFILETNQLEGVVAYSEEIKHILYNIIENSLKYTSGGEIRICLSRFYRKGENWAKVSIIDQGQGILKKYQRKIFKNNYRIPSATPIHGSGIGLAICRKLAQKIGAIISINSPVFVSEKKNPGTEFNVFLKNVNWL